ncbi:MAG: hypothetical protein H6Q49_1053 [Deltaproteobacteria bacterium]|nr:hypothetical protein [Deltaproteobacteria bacterium]
MAFPDLDTHCYGLVDGRADYLFLAALEIPFLKIYPDFRTELSSVIPVFPAEDVHDRFGYLYELGGRMTQ